MAEKSSRRSREETIKHMEKYRNPKTTNNNTNDTDEEDSDSGLPSHIHCAHHKKKTKQKTKTKRNNTGKKTALLATVNNKIIAK